MDVFKRLSRFYWTYRWVGLFSIVSMILATALGFVRPVMLRQIVDEVVIGKHYNELPLLILIVAGAALLRSLFVFGKSYIGHLFGAASVYDLRCALYDKLQSLPYSYYDKARTGDLMSRLAGDVEVFRQFLAFGLANIVDFVLMFVFGLSLMFSMNWQLTLVTLVTMPGLIFLVLRFSKKVHKAFSKVRKSAAEINTAVQENITGIRTVKVFARERHQVQSFGDKNQSYKRSNLDTSFLWAKYFPSMETLSNFSVLLLIWYGARQVQAGLLTEGGFVAFFSLIWYIIGPVQQLGYHINNLSQSIAAGERVLEILNSGPAMPDGGKALHSEEFMGRVTFDDVSFSFDKCVPVLKGITLDAPQGTIIGITGPTGSGKSTLVSLLYRAYDVSSGRITFDGVDIRDYTVASLRHCIANVFQETFLFSTTIIENIRYGRRDATDEEVIEVSKLAQAHDFISELPNGYQTLVGERGLGLSGGQKQRIAIARALLSNPRILVLDDATASVDMETEREIQAGLRQIAAGRTVFVIAHRISSLRDADEIIVLDKGEIVERGSHSELLAQQGLYRRIFDVQYGDAEETHEAVV